VLVRLQKYIVKGPEEKFEVVPKIQLLSAEGVTYRGSVLERIASILGARLSELRGYLHS